MPHFAQWVVTTFGYWAVPLSIAVESLGIPIPAETTLLVAAAMSATHLLDIRAVIALAAIGATLGGCGGYTIGRVGGRALINRVGARVGLSPPRLRFIEGFFRKHGNKTVLLGRFQFVLRTYTAVFAGVAHMPFGVFMRYNVLGGVSWAVIYGVLGYSLGANWDRLQVATRDFGLGALLALLLLGGAFWWTRLRNRVHL